MEVPVALTGCYWAGFSSEQRNLSMMHTNQKMPNIHLWALFLANPIIHSKMLIDKRGHWPSFGRPHTELLPPQKGFQGL